MTTGMAVQIGDPRAPVTIDGAAEVGHENGWACFDRLPVSDPGYDFHHALRVKSGMPAGVRLSFVTDATALQLEVYTDMPAELAAEVRPFDVLVDGERVSRSLVVGTGTVEVGGLSSSLKQVEVWLPQFGRARLGRLTLPDASVLHATGSEGPRWVAYGSSITQCRGADGPSQTWPALVARQYGYRLQGLGFGGEAHLDGDVARFIRSRPADLISLCLGINIYGSATYSARSLGPAIQWFVRTVREGHPATPLLVISPIASPERESQPNAVGMTLADVRTTVAQSVGSLNQADDIRLLDGRELLGPDDAHLLEDGLHPNQDGYTLMSRRLVELGVLDLTRRSSA